MNIDRCYCFEKTFEELKVLADARTLTSVEELQTCADFGHNCRLCHPYVRRMLRTGAVSFDRIVTDVEEPKIGVMSDE